VSDLKSLNKPKQILVICGPTATGKTALALKLAKKFSGEIISADSRQVYKGMDVGTGKDIPKKFKVQSSKFKVDNKKAIFYGNGTKIWGYDLVSPGQEFSAAHFSKFAWKLIDYLWQQKKLPIVVGGTGLYIQTLFNPPSSLGVVPNLKLRKSLQNLPTAKLQASLKNLSPTRLKQMNHSDKNNPRRLIRAIEIATQQKKLHFDTAKYKSKLKTKHHALWIGLKTNKSALDQRINTRVVKRIRQGMTSEVNKLKSLLTDTHLQSSSSIGYQQWLAFIQEKLTKKQAIHRWQQAERQYARRQLTWFKKNPQINWFDISRPKTTKKVVDSVKNWYAVENGRITKS